MIYDTFDNIELYFNPKDTLYRALSYARDFDPSQPDGRYEIHGDAMFALVMTYDTKRADAGRFEAHRKCLDVQLLLVGNEFMDTFVVGKDVQPSRAYSEEGDLLFFPDPEYYSRIALYPGAFAILYPHDAHRPGCLVEARAEVRKMVIKVAI